MSRKTALPSDDVEMFRITPANDFNATTTRKQPTRRQREGFCPVFPLMILRVVVEEKAIKALPLIMAVHRQLHMVKKKSVPLTGVVWNASGYVSRKDKTAALQKLRKLSKVIRLIPKRQTMHSYYDVAYGSLWKQKGAE